MEAEVIGALIAGVFLLLSTITSAIAAYLTKRTSDSVRDEGQKLSKRFDQSNRFSYVEGDRDAHDALTRLTLNEPTRVSVTRFSPKGVQRQKRYYDAIRSKILGREFEGTSYAKLDKYNRLTSLCSEENKQSLIDMIEDFLERGCNNLTIRVTADKNDFELLIFEKLKTAALCFHDMSKQDVVHSCIIVNDLEIFSNFLNLYQKAWSEDIILEIDFSQGLQHVKRQLDILKRLEPIEKNDTLSPLESLIFEAKQKIRATELISNSQHG